jgi:hypothetical protein
MGGKHRKTHSTPSADLDFPSVGDCFTGSLTSSAGTITETAGGNVVTYTATLNTPAATALSIPYTLGGTATAITDYTVNTGTINIAAGALTGTLVLTATPDFLTETGGETVSVALNAIAGATVNTTPVTTAITDTSTTPAPGTVNNIAVSAATAATTPAAVTGVKDIYTMALGNYAATITNFDAANDKLSFGTGITAASIVITNNAADGQATFSYSADGINTETITITGLSTVQDIALTTSAGLTAILA